MGFSILAEQNKKLLKIMFRAVIIAAIVYFFSRAVYGSWGELKDFSWDFNYSYLLIAVIFTFGVYAFTVIGYAFILNRLKIKLPFIKRKK